MKLYLAGPMSGLPDFNYPTFDRYAKLLREKEFEVFNPAEAHNGETGLPLSKYFETDLPEVCRADAVAVLPGWRDSKGASIEVDLARHLGKTIYDAVILASYGMDPVDAIITETEETSYQGESYDPAEVTTSNGFVFYEHDPERHTSQTGGVKDNVNKPRLDLIPSLPLFRAGEVLSFGARKYKPHNWRLGLSWLETYGSLQRHLAAWLDGEDNDRESGYHHLAHALCQMLFLAEFVFRGTGEDDRFVTLEAEEMMAREDAESPGATTRPEES